MRYFKEGRKYDEYRFIAVKNARYHIEVTLESYDESYFVERAKGAFIVARQIAETIKRPLKPSGVSEITPTKKGVKQTFYFNK